jgi:hypothetical protein
MQKTIYLRFSLLIIMVLMAAFSRLIPHIPNFSPLGAIGLFGAAYFDKKWQAFLIPIAATWLSDLFINNIIYRQYFSEFTWFYQGFYWQYGSYLLIVLAGIFILKTINIQKIVVGAIAPTTIFFLVSNFGVWASGSMYPKTFEGLLTCYVAGIPFLKGTMLGDFFYSGVLFGSFAIAQKKLPILQLKNV